MNKSILILGASGFVGKELVAQAARAGWRVKALVRSSQTAREFAAAGVEPVFGSAEEPELWMQEAGGVDVIVNLVQPKLPRKLGVKEIEDVSAQRQRMTRGLMAALASLPEPARPLWIEVSGIDDLQPDANGGIDSRSPLKTTPTGFAHIGIPVRRQVEASGVASAFVYLGTVYGPGKTFAETVFPQLAAGRWRTPGNGENSMPLVHVEDAARGLLYVAGLGRPRTQGRSFVLTDGSNASLNQFFGFAAQQLGVAAPGHAPKWLASAVAGKAAVETMTRDLHVTPFFAQEPGFLPTYPSFREGLPPTLEKLGLAKKPAPPARSFAERLPFMPLMVAALGIFIALQTLHFPFSVQGMQDIANGLTILDARLHYTAEDAYRLFDALGAAGRSRYLAMLWTQDMIVPAIWALFLSAAIGKGRLRRARNLPYLAAGLDYAENVAISALILMYPERSTLLVSIAAVLTLVKQVAYWSSALLAIVGGLANLRPGMRRTA